LYFLYLLHKFIMETNIKQKKSKNRKTRYTFPNELDECSINTVKHKRRHSIQNTIGDDYDIYNETYVIIKKNADGVKKEVIFKKYTKVHPIISDTIIENNYDKCEDDKSNVNNSTQKIKISNILFKIAIKILCYIGICIAI